MTAWICYKSGSIISKVETVSRHSIAMLKKIIKAEQNHMFVRQLEAIVIDDAQNKLIHIDRYGREETCPKVPAEWLEWRQNNRPKHRT